MEKQHNRLKAIMEWMEDDLPNNIPMMCIICPAMAGIGIAIVITVLGLAIKLLKLIF